jgi:hypothetical protein
VGVAKSAGVGCLGLLAIGMVMAALGRHVSAPETATAAAKAAPDPRQAEKDLQARTAMAAGAALKSTARDPDSLVIESGLASDDGKLLCVRYRARNGFGGMNREAVAFSNMKPVTGASFWNAHCANRTLNDLTATVKLGASMPN